MFTTAERKNYAVLVTMVLLGIIAAVSGQVNLPIISTTETPTEACINVQTVLGLVPGSPSEASNNSYKLNQAINSATYNKPFFFPGGDWYFGADTTTTPTVNGTCILTDDTSGWSFTSGAAGWRVVNDGSGNTGPTAAQIIYAGPRLGIAPGATVSATALIASPTVVNVTGYDVKTQDVGGTLQVTGGTNAILDATLLSTQTCSFYVVTAIDDANNRWTLDRACVTGGDCTNLTGLFTYTLWRDRGYANYYQGLHFKGHPDVGQRISFAASGDGVHSVTGASATITMTKTPTVVQSADVGGIVWIAGGPTAIPGYYTIVSVNVGAKTWTLDRVCTTGSTTNGLTGAMEYPRCHVGMHVITDDLNNDGTVTQDPLTGKHLYMGNSWSDFNVMNLAGKDMRKAYAKAALNTITGEALMDNHADHLNHINSNAEHGMTFLYLRNRQSLGHTIRSQMYATNIAEAFCYAERGGHVLIDGITVGGSRGHTFRIGIQNNQSGNNVIRDLSHDANPNFYVPRCFRHDQGNGQNDTEATTIFDGLHIDTDITAWSAEAPFDVYSGDRLEVRNFTNLRANTFKLTKSPGTYRPFVVLNGCRTTTSLTTVADTAGLGAALLQDDSSVQYGTLRWRDLTNFSGAGVYVDGSVSSL